MVKCPVCGMEFETEEEHIKHHREVHGGEIIPEGMEEEKEDKEDEEKKEGEEKN